MADLHSKPRRLATAALNAAIDKDWKRAEAAIQRLNDECGADALGYALVAWCDSGVIHANGGVPDAEFWTKVVPWNVDTGAINEVMEPHMKWGADLAAARAALDLPRFQELLGELNAIADGMERGRRVGALVASLATTIRSLPRGYGRTPEGVA